MLRLPVLLALAALFAVPAAASAVSGDTAPRQAFVCEAPQNQGDADCDATPDASDRCPSQAGISGGEFAGCPDADRDNVPDDKDGCPTQPGMIGPANSGTGENWGGCPDTDGDRVEDPYDACPGSGRSDNPDYGVTTDGCLDRDRDNVRDDQDQCLGQHNSGGDDVDEYGCPPFEVSAALVDTKTTKNLADGPRISLQCANTRLACKVRATLTLTAGSARKLGVAREVFDVARTNPRKKTSNYFYSLFDIDVSRKVQRAFDRAYARRIAVKMTLTGEYSIGDGPTRKLSKDTFVLTHRDQSAAYAFMPWVGAGPDGPTPKRKPSGDDF